jgi:PAN domain-containing protein
MFAVVAITMSLLSGSAFADSFERGVDRPGSDYTRFSVYSARECHSACRADDRCAAWTFVKAGYQASVPICWLKSDVPGAVGNWATISGVVR